MILFCGIGTKLDIVNRFLTFFEEILSIFMLLIVYEYRDRQKGEK